MKNDIHDLNLLLDSKIKLIVIESWEERRVLETMAALAIKRAQTWYTWNLLDGLRRLGFGADVEASEDTTDPETALKQIRRANEQALYVFCDLHPYLESPRLIRLLKTLAMEPGASPTVVLVSHAIALPPELSRLAARLNLSMPSDEQLAGKSVV